MSHLENHFQKFRQNIIGIDTTYPTPYGVKKMLYCDWIASVRLCAPIEKIMTERFRNDLCNQQITKDIGT